jgi:hypothetical protein
VRDSTPRRDAYVREGALVQSNNLDRPPHTLDHVNLLAVHRTAKELVL